MEGDGRERADNTSTSKIERVICCCCQPVIVVLRGGNVWRGCVHSSVHYGHVMLCNFFSYKTKPNHKTRPVTSRIASLTPLPTQFPQDYFFVVFLFYFSEEFIWFVMDVADEESIFVLQVRLVRSD